MYTSVYSISFIILFYFFFLNEQARRTEPKSNETNGTKTKRSTERERPTKRTTERTRQARQTETERRRGGLQHSAAMTMFSFPSSAAVVVVVRGSSAVVSIILLIHFTCFRSVLSFVETLGSSARWGLNPFLGWRALEKTKRLTRPRPLIDGRARTDTAWDSDFGVTTFVWPIPVNIRSPWCLFGFAEERVFYSLASTYEIWKWSSRRNFCFTGTDCGMWSCAFDKQSGYWSAFQCNNYPKIFMFSLPVGICAVYHWLRSSFSHCTRSNDYSPAGLSWLWFAMCFRNEDKLERLTWVEKIKPNYLWPWRTMRAIVPSSRARKKYWHVGWRTEEMQMQRTHTVSLPGYFKIKKQDSLHWYRIFFLPKQEILHFISQLC